MDIYVLTMMWVFIMDYKNVIMLKALTMHVWFSLYEQRIIFKSQDAKKCDTMVQQKAILVRKVLLFVPSKMSN